MCVSQIFPGSWSNSWNLLGPLLVYWLVVSTFTLGGNQSLGVTTAATLLSTVTVAIFYLPPSLHPSISWMFCLNQAGSDQLWSCRLPGGETPQQSWFSLLDRKETGGDPALRVETGSGWSQKTSLRETDDEGSNFLKLLSKRRFSLILL